LQTLFTILELNDDNQLSLSVTSDFKNLLMFSAWCIWLYSILLQTIKEHNVVIFNDTLNISRQPVNLFGWMMFSYKSTI